MIIIDKSTLFSNDLGLFPTNIGFYANSWPLI